MKTDIILDIGLCTHGCAMIKNYPAENMISLLPGYLYIKNNDDGLFSKSADFATIVISDIPISAFQEASHDLVKDSDFKKRFEKHAPASATKTSGLVSLQFRELFEKITGVTSLLGISPSTVSNYHSASLILYHLGNGIPTPAETAIWNALCGFINIDKCTFLLKMHNFLDYDNVPKINAMAKIMGMPLTGFKIKCDEYLNTTAHRWLVKQKLHRAYTLTLTSNLIIGDIGTLCKFDNASYFIKLFRIEFGITPLALRQSAVVLDS